MDWQQLWKQKWLLFVAAVGVLMLIVGSMVQAHPAKSSSALPVSTTDAFTSSLGTSNASDSLPTAPTERHYDDELDAMLAKIQGVRAVNVMVVLTNGGNLAGSGSTGVGVAGVLVTLDADNFFTAKTEIVDAITNVLDVPAYKISVEPQKGD
ncbi:stage III sporulation protein AG [Alicyclobacillus sacchari]|uniref:Stage III sporulation protein AG n=1 Tax=Alicyclobacillus sacchari TaxID=392010 RepID=A0A4R8LIX4_9BACL|nr:hypothetical protein [Alicyclobacillus sacchari]TDY43397.1 stage III sporulation protein AG [Alicyclobacillus sacchari]GMA55857.1 hypothetical protein GCM10025858_03600 [Alicyclobacillus sacchari]